jgi:hypothetical protein
MAIARITAKKSPMMAHVKVLAAEVRTFRGNITRRFFRFLKVLPIGH